MTIQLGNNAEGLSVRMYRGTDFSCELHVTNAAGAPVSMVGIDLRLRLGLSYELLVPGTVGGVYAIDIPDATVDTLGSEGTAKLDLVAGSVTTPWARGQFKVGS